MFSFLKKTPPPAPADVPTVAPATAPPQPDAKPTAAPSWRERLFQGLARTRAQWGGKLKSVFARGKVDDELLEELETLLLTSDVGIEATTHLLDELKKAAKRDKLDSPESIQAALADALPRPSRWQPLDVSAHSPYVIMIAGVNGAGKTTTIGKLAKYFQSQGKSVLLAAGDTFRAAAREQLQTWGERNNVTVIAQESGDPAAVIFDAISAAKARGIDVVLADTAGRLPTQLHLMVPGSAASSEGRTGRPARKPCWYSTRTSARTPWLRSGLRQGDHVTGLVLTKLDGTAKGRVAAIARQCRSRSASLA